MCESQESAAEALNHNPLLGLLPVIGYVDHRSKGFQPQYVALVVGNSRAGPTVRAASAEWRKACRLNDVKEYRGVTGQARETYDVPEAILSALLAYQDDRSYRDECSYNEGVITLPYGDQGGVCVDLSIALRQVRSSSFEVHSLREMGLLGLQCTNAHSKLSRSKYNEPPKVSSDDTSFIWLQQKKCHTEPSLLVVVIGLAGCFVPFIAEKLTEKLARESLPERGKLSRKVRLALIDLTEHLYCNSINEDSEAVRLGDAVVDAWQSCFKDAVTTDTTVGSMYVVGVSLPALHDFPIDRVLPLLCACAGSTSRVVALIPVVSLQALDLPAQLCGLGLEQWNSRALNACIAGQAADLVIALDMPNSPNSLYSEFRTMLSQLNPFSVPVRFVFPQERLDERHMDYLLSVIRSNCIASVEDTCSVLCGQRFDLYEFAKRLSCKELRIAVTVSPRFSMSALLSRHDKLQSSVIAQIKTLRSFKIINEEGTWTIASITQLLEYLLPNAQTFMSRDHNWPIPLNFGSVGLKRAVELAAAKVFFGRRQLLERQSLERKLRELEDNDNDSGSIRSCLLSVSGSAEGVHMVEANRGSILVRPFGELVSRNVLKVTGIMSDHQESLIRLLFKLCTRQEMSRREHVTYADLSKKQLIDMQNDDPKTKKMPLPSGWYFDGSDFWGPHGVTNCSREMRPDIEEIAKRRLQKVNIEVGRYNCFLDLHLTPLEADAGIQGQARARVTHTHLV
jgi:hypothetical protein